MTFTLSTEALNSYGFITRTDGIDIAEFQENPVMLFAHNPELVIGRWEHIRKDGATLLADAVFDESDAFALQIKRKVEQGFLKATSIGFNIDWTSAQVAGGVTTIHNSKLLEGSIVAIPANKEAQLVQLSQEQNKQLQQLLNKQNNTSSMKLVTQYLGLKQEAGEADLLASFHAKDAEIQKLQAELATLKKEALAKAEAAKTALLSAAVKDGKITKKEAEVFKTLSDADLAAILAERKAAAPPSISELLQKTTSGDNGETGFWELSKKDPDKLADIRANDPELYKALYKKEFGVTLK